MSHIALTGLAKDYAGSPALRDFSLTIAKGEFVSLLGPSGCGKTTTLRILAGFETASAGEARMGDQDILRLPAHRRRMGVVFQNYALFPHLTAAGNIAFGLKIARRPASEIAATVARMLDLVGLPDKGDHLPAELSGGQQQRIAIARALATDPAMLLLDEPLSALDAVVRVELRDRIREIQSALGITTVFVTHDQEEALAVSDRIVVMRAGVIEQVGTPEDIYLRPATRFVASFIGRMSLIDGIWRNGALSAGDLSLRVATDQPPRDGMGATLLLRPEALRLTDPATSIAGWNSLLARVRASVFQGGMRRLTLEAAGQEFLADLPSDQGTAPRGTELRLNFAPDACRLLPRETEAA
ncbi:ABC transporter ATP-binding protein [Paracoccus aminophilus]|uniref:Spermidine/putrescine transport system ATP-binding protein n=1 Tax=Paracoccus aminophilus JCM 7686 TaxID=1367847 RepID=S5XX16_PARAH|nr:ABC transporter ATP-binding protein [Paracoccus aminophilus]AGT09857.1 spermidine/putrescine transport system ATP-binding protein [Paracoccus aminophilus JCM 7686]